MATKWTSDQLEAITLRGKNILVSASAGSGKTTVLVERIIREILAGEDIQSLLIVTFTKAATEEMRQKIQSKLIERLQSNLESADRQRIQTALNRINTANIQTLDAFNLQLVQRYYYLLDLDPGFRLLADEAERQMLEEQVWDQLREVFFASAQQADFIALNEQFNNDRNDNGLQELVFRLVDFAMINPEPAAWLAQLVADFQASDFETTSVYRDQFWPLIRTWLMTIDNLLATAQSEIDPTLMKPWADNLAASRAPLQEVIATDLPSYATLTQLDQVDFGRWPSNKLEDEALKAAKEAAKTPRDAAKSLFDQQVRPLIQVSATDLTKALTASQPLVATLVSVAQEFMTSFAAEKQRRHLQDYGDLAHNALAIINYVDPDTHIAMKDVLSQQYSEIMVDEYQDLNPLQEALLAGLSRQPGNRFMVGDMKQSIYAFRLADPKMFYQKYLDYADGHNGYRVILADNFRSSKNVIDFTNFIFEQLMDVKVGEMDYDEAAKLIKHANYPDDYAPTTEILLYDKTISEKPLTDSQGQVQLIIQKIQALMDGQHQIYDANGQLRPVRYQDITLLARSRSLNPLIQDAFNQAGIPIVVADAKNFFKTTELQVMLSMLRIIDNPKQEIALVAVLRSPIVGLSADELSQIHLAAKDKPFYDALDVFLQQGPSPATHNLFDRLKDFVRQLDRFRTLARNNQLVDLIWAIYQETGYLDFVAGMPGGAQRQANLRALYERAHAYEDNGFQGLFEFVHFIELMQKQDNDLALPVVLNPDVDAVSLLTIHQSKGLEFPIVFVINIDKSFNKQDLRQNAVITQAGLGFAWLNPENRMVVPLPQFYLAQNAAVAKLRAEEMRLLYVALTRAQQQLILVGAATAKDREKWLQGSDSEHVRLPETTRLQANSFLDLIGPALVRHPDFPEGASSSVFAHEASHFSLEFLDASAAVTTTSLTTEPERSIEPDQPTLAALQRWFAFEYPFAAETTTTGFQSVSEIKRAFDDPDSLELVDSSTVVPVNRFQDDLATPAFIETTKTVSAAAVGTATHLVLQKIDLSQPVSAALINDTIDNLTQMQLIETPVADRINRANLLQFFQGDVGQLLLANPSKVVREAPFSMLVPATELFGNLNDATERILVHGIIDGYVQTHDGILLYDFKTDQADAEALLQRYTIQLNLYREALSRVQAQPVYRQVLIGLANGLTVDVPQQSILAPTNG
ncbi:helicase-exonuclease AddAB subunit AddA [Lacticaseibacillus brantae]|uniref:ATP-dependent helicase/nuclease subunit A n=1 Tax=Lacticaseibacillus brantae DSM 23927 TaxID=1423727 RepID=A0A0R2B957_9LACO|nr:helicase-exonuclease AddAB subunit AddA [Lacticaseibacillus brantae]KRM72678.1 ATP-dependent deoxyribonuclease, subunit A [Lacticaseibacillus brantae DSM 23927]